MKKWLLIISMGVIIASLTACGSGDSGKADKSTTKEGKTLLTLSLPESNPFYQTLEKKFEEKYPDIDLQINAFKNMGEVWAPEEHEEYRTRTNTAMLSGKDMDILYMDSLPIKEYVDKGFLFNMNDSMEQDQTVNKDDLQMDIVNGLKLNDGMYTIPVGYSFSVLVGNGDMLGNANVTFDDTKWDWKEFEKVSREVIQKAKKSGTDEIYALASYPPDYLFQELLLENYIAFVDTTAKKAKFDSPEFVDLLQQVKKMSDDKVITSEEAKPGNLLFSSQLIRSPLDFIEGPFLTFDNPKIMLSPRVGDTASKGARVFVSDRFAINAKSPVKDEAWKFIAFLLSEEVQLLQEREGFSMLKSVNEKLINDIQDKVKSGDYTLANGQRGEDTDEQFTVFKQTVQSADQYLELDGQVFNIAGEESLAFFSGQKSAEEVAELIQNRVTTYLNE